MNYRPQFYKTNKEEDRKRMAELKELKNPEIFDSIDGQLLELLLCRNPNLSEDDVINMDLVDHKVKESGHLKQDYGVWVYYPWKNQLIHILDEEEFIEVRTNRNKYKITQEEQDILRTKIIGIAGLSVGRAVAMTIALERIAGEIRLADFDSIALSNLNRIEAPLTELGINKSIATAREIAEIDPFIKVVCFIEGLVESNLQCFFSNDGVLDLFVEECDDLEIKIKSRLVAKKLRVPVIMETNDNCIIDIERYDLEPDREIFHGRLDKYLIKEAFEAQSIEAKTKVLSAILDSSKISARMKDSIPEFNKSIRSWPQIGSEVIYGGALTAALVRLILLGELNVSDRFSLDLLKVLNIQYISFDKC